MSLEKVIVLLNDGKGKTKDISRDNLIVKDSFLKYFHRSC